MGSNVRRKKERAAEMLRRKVQPLVDKELK